MAKDPRSSGPDGVALGSQWWWVMAVAAANGSGQPTDAKQRSQVTAMAPSSPGVV
jgi:hypothetical protein